MPFKQVTKERGLGNLVSEQFRNQFPHDLTVHESQMDYFCDMIREITAGKRTQLDTFKKCFLSAQDDVIGAGIPFDPRTWCDAVTAYWYLWQPSMPELDKFYDEVLLPLFKRMPTFIVQAWGDLYNILESGKPSSRWKNVSDWEGDCNMQEKRQPGVAGAWGSAGRERMVVNSYCRDMLGIWKNFMIDNKPQNRPG